MEIPKNLTLDEKIELYKKLSPDDVMQGKYISDYEFGFFTFNLVDDEMCIFNVLGDGKRLNQEFEKIAKENNVKKIYLIAKKAAPIERKYGFKIDRYIMVKEV